MGDFGSIDLGGEEEGIGAEGRGRDLKIGLVGVFRPKAFTRLQHLPKFAILLFHHLAISMIPLFAEKRRLSTEYLTDIALIVQLVHPKNKLRDS